MAITYLDYKNKSDHVATREEVEALLKACAENDLNTVRHLVETVGVSVNPGWVEDGWVPLCAALKNKSNDVVDYLLANGAELLDDSDVEEELYDAYEDDPELEKWILIKICTCKPNLSGEYKIAIEKRIVSINDQTLTSCYVKRFPGQLLRMVIDNYSHKADLLKKWVKELVLQGYNIKLNNIDSAKIAKIDNESKKFLENIERLVAFLDSQNCIERKDYGKYLEKEKIDVFGLALANGLITTYEEFQNLFTICCSCADKRRI